MVMIPVETKAATTDHTIIMMEMGRDTAETSQIILALLKDGTEVSMMQQNEGALAFKPGPFLSRIPEYPAVYSSRKTSNGFWPRIR